MTSLKVQKLAKGGGPNVATPGGVKSALAALGVVNNDHLSRPLRNLTDGEKLPIPGILNELGL